jgi:polar amino acid transport system permease protein
MRYELEFSAPLAYWQDLLAGAATTLGLSVAATVLGFGLGVACAIARTGRSRAASAVAGAYVEVIRNTPLLVQIFIVYFGLASVGIRLGAFTAAILALVVNVGAYTAEIIRAGMESVPRSQREAGECLALGRWQLLRHVILPPAIERVWPALTSQYVLLMLASSITSQISAEELTATANLVQSDTYRSFEVYVIVAVVYLALSALYRLGFWAIGLILFERRRRLGTPL